MKRPILFPALLAASLLAPAVARAQFIPGPSCDQISIRNIVAMGDGCPAGTASTLITSTRPGCLNADFLEVVFSQFKVEKGPMIPLSESRKQCTVIIDLLIPQGFRYTLFDVHYEGFGNIPRGSSGSLRSEYFFPFIPGRPTSTKTLSGPFFGDFTKDNTLGILSLVWSPCGQLYPLNVKSDLRLAGPSNAAAVMTVDTLTGRVRQRWGLRWQRCP